MGEISFAGQVAIVTGAGRGMGRAYAIELARRGTSIVVNDIGGVGTPDGPWADLVVREIQAAGGRAVASYDTVGTIEGGQAITDAALSAFGTVDIVISNAGILRRGMFEETSLLATKEIIDVHLLGAFYVIQPAWKVMAKKNYGRVVIIGSAASLGMKANSNYSAAKAGLLGLTSCLAYEGEDCGIRANAVLPYAKTLISTENPAVGPDAALAVGLQKQLWPRMTFDSVSAATLYLASSDCKVSGQAISALAGRYARTFIMQSEGWLRENIEGITIEEFGDHIDEILDLTHLFEPKSLTGELEHVIERVGAIEQK